MKRSNLYLWTCSFLIRSCYKVDSELVESCFKVDRKLLQSKSGSKLICSGSHLSHVGFYIVVEGCTGIGVS